MSSTLYVCFGEYQTAINCDFYGENVGSLPGDFIILLCLCHGDLNGEQPSMGSSVSYLLNGETITAFLFRLCKLRLDFFLTIFKHLKQSLNIPLAHIALLDLIKHQQTVQNQIRYCFIILWHSLDTFCLPSSYQIYLYEITSKHFVENGSYGEYTERMISNHHYCM